MTPPLLAVSNLTLAFGGTTVVDGVSFTLEAGKTLALVGASGSGKTTLALGLMNLAQPARRLRGTVALRGIELVDGPQWQAVRGREIGLVMQSPGAALNPMLSIGWQIAEVLQTHHELPYRQAQKRAAEWLERVGMSPLRYRARPYELSGGQRQRVAIAMALAGEPAVLIADEPTSALDLSTQAHVLGLLQALQREHGTAMLFVTHDVALLPGLADDVLRLDHGRAVS